MSVEDSTLVVVARAALEGGAACGPAACGAQNSRGRPRQWRGPAAPGRRPGLRDGACLGD